MPSVCEIKIALKAKGIKGITGLNKGQLEALLNKDGSAAQQPLKKMTPAATKGESPKIAEKKITKKARVVKPLMITYKEEVKAETKTKPPPKLKRAKQTEDERLDMLTMKRELPACIKFIKQAGIKNEEELKKYIITNHPDKLKNQDPNSKAAILYKELLNCSTVLRTMKNYVKEGYVKSFKSFFSN